MEVPQSHVAIISCSHNHGRVEGDVEGSDWLRVGKQFLDDLVLPDVPDVQMIVSAG